MITIKNSCRLRGRSTFSTLDIYCVILVTEIVVLVLVVHPVSDGGSHWPKIPVHEWTNQMRGVI